jgi:hypothetical protein
MQMKLLTHNERVRYSLLVVALASRDGERPMRICVEGTVHRSKGSTYILQ